MALAEERGCDPLDAMLEALEELLGAARTAGPLGERLGLYERAAAIAKDAAPYLHPRLAAMAIAQEERQEPSRIGRLTRDELIDLLIEARERERRREQPEPPLTLVDDEENDDRSGRSIAGGTCRHP